MRVDAQRICQADLGAFRSSASNLTIIKAAHFANKQRVFATSFMALNRDLFLWQA